MNPLNALECKEFWDFYYPKLLNIGLIEPLEEFYKSHNGNISEAIQSLYVNLSEAKSFKTSLQEMKPNFPKCVEELLICAESKGLLDEAVKQLKANDTETEATILNKASTLLAKLNDTDSSGNLCNSCIERELTKIFKRAKIEGAKKVILEQDEEFLFHQKYIAIKLVHIAEACHPMLHNSLYALISQNSVLEFSDTHYNIEPQNKSCFLVSKSNQKLLVSFQ